jgi:uncharacterized membrane protein YidH (DUF202 family)
MSDGGRLFDPGLQPERTALAWRRTGLSVAVGAVACARLLVPTLGTAAVVLVVLGVALAVLFLLGAAKRARRAQDALLRDGDLACGPGGRMVAAVCVGCTAVGVTALAVVVNMRVQLGR